MTEGHCTPIRREYVVGFAFNQMRDRVLLIEKARPDWQAGKLNGVGGKIEFSETPLQAMRREFKEETDLYYFSWDCVGTLEGQSCRIWLFRAWEHRNIHLIKDAKKTTDETPVVCDVHKLPTNVVPNVKWLVPLLLEPKQVHVSVEIADYK